jgi:predicted nucleic acid-binding protein
MNFPIFIDANVPIYAAGRAHPLKEPCNQIILIAARYPGRFVSDAEVVQELLHRYMALNLYDQGREVIHRFADVLRDRIEPLNLGDVLAAMTVADRQLGLSARDLVHLSVMTRLGVDSILSADRGFDNVRGITRLDPGNLESWRSDVVSGLN